MEELIALAKKNSFAVICMLLVTLYLQDRMHDESLAIRQEMAGEFADVREEMATGFAAVRQEMTTGFADVRQEMSEFGERLTRIETLLEQLLLESKNQ